MRATSFAEMTLGMNKLYLKVDYRNHTSFFVVCTFADLSGLKVSARSLLEASLMCTRCFLEAISTPF